MFAYIPARSGSKRIKNKNIKNFMGKPIIAWVIEIVQKSKLVESIYVSTDDKKIADIAEDHGAKIIKLREVHYVLNMENNISNSFKDEQDAYASIVKSRNKNI